ncbi:hypothetical protein DUNSADRAFT_600 [Dunaliella salina]|uniref:Uncharacterized protein n=1 Tax=Dunaliella salina TaxID=3046 RepID=A0ABQ7GY46_DUNSA|nr:hypothetical protein DUNSADRAFT_600 [Dunaliella salina]|eukprot:KAF5839528.1 hypothetical protein DUNSADRAFT_600 [Dunaliella salina]
MLASCYYLLRGFNTSMRVLKARDLFVLLVLSIFPPDGICVLAISDHPWLSFFSLLLSSGVVGLGLPARSLYLLTWHKFYLYHSSACAMHTTRSFGS